MSLSTSTGCFPAYAELTGGAHSLSGDELDSTFTPSVGINLGIPFEFPNFGFAIGIGADAMGASTPQGDLTVWPGGAILRGDWNLNHAAVGDKGYVLYRITGVYSGPGRITLGDEGDWGTAHAIHLGGTVGWVGDTSSLLATLGPHATLANQPDLGAIRAYGAQLRLRLYWMLGHGGQ